MNDNNKPFSVAVTQADFGVIRASLIHSVEFWKHTILTGDYPEKFDEGKAKELVKINQSVLEKVETILTMTPIPSSNVGVTRGNNA